MSIPILQMKKWRPRGIRELPKVIQLASGHLSAQYSPSPSAPPLAKEQWIIGTTAAGTHSSRSVPCALLCVLPLLTHVILTATP